MEEEKPQSDDVTDAAAQEALRHRFNIVKCQSVDHIVYDCPEAANGEAQKQLMVKPRSSWW